MKKTCQRLEADIEKRIVKNYGIPDEIKERFMRAKHKRHNAVSEMERVYVELVRIGKWELNKEGRWHK